jgi:hypothetical protein
MWLLPPGAFVVDDHLQQSDADVGFGRVRSGGRRSRFGTLLFRSRAAKGQ